jgi:hypothetical protein
MSCGKAFAVQLAPTFTPVAPSVTINGALTSLGNGLAAAAPIAAGAAAAAGAVFLTRAALRGLATLDERDRAAAGAVAANRAEAFAWDRVFAEVMIRNARIVRLREMTTSASPEPFVYGSETRDEVHDWCRQMDKTLADAERQVADARRRAALARRGSGPAEFVRRRVERTLVRREATPEPIGPATPARTSAPTAKPAEPPVMSTVDKKSPRPVVDDILNKAVSNVSPDDFTQLTEKAAEVLAQDDLRTTKAELDELYLMADRARRAQERRESDALLAAQWLVALAPLADQPAGMSAFQAEILVALREAAAERRELDPSLREAATALAELAVTAAEDRAISAMFARELAALGYTVDVADGFSPQVSVSRPEWGDAHRATVDVRSGDLEATFETVADDATGRPDLHKAAWAEHIVEVKERAAEQGVRSGKLSMTDDPRPLTRREDTDSGADEDIRASRPNQMERPTPTC